VLEKGNCNWEGWKLVRQLDRKFGSRRETEIFVSPRRNIEEQSVTKDDESVTKLGFWSVE
jgi:hypothetical protein